MNTSSRGICIFTLSLLVFLLSSSVVPSVALLRSPTSIFSASKLIRSLNLFPGRSVNIVDDEFDDRDAPKLVEKRIHFPNLFDSRDGATADELGHHAGYYRIQHSHDGRMFYFFFESRNSQEDPVVIWLTGGPGCSSELALFYENGPFRIADNLSLVWNEYGWDKVSNILFVDQPIGTGFSYTTDSRDIPHDEKGVSDDLYDFLQAFFREHPHLVQNDFYITGESYAGHYIPAFAARVHQGNQANEGIHVNLKGFAMGNGLTDPAIQYAAYSDFALNMGLINQSEHDQINNALPLCESAINLCGTDGIIACMAAYVFCNRIFDAILAQAGNINYYDIRRECEGSLCYDFSNLESYLNQESVREAIGVGDIEFVSCSPTVYHAMLMDWMRNLEVGIPALLEDGVKMLVYAGEYDLICNWLGNSRWVHAMEWSGQRGFQAATEVPFEVDGSEAGLLASYGPLSFLKVHNAGHMVPMDQPKASLDMLSRWMNGSLSQPLAESETDDLLVSSI